MIFDLYNFVLFYYILQYVVFKDIYTMLRKKWEVSYEVSYEVRYWAIKVKKLQLFNQFFNFYLRGCCPSLDEKSNFLRAYLNFLGTFLIKKK